MSAKNTATCSTERPCVNCFSGQGVCIGPHKMSGRVTDKGFGVPKEAVIAALNAYNETLHPKETAARYVVMRDALEAAAPHMREGEAKGDEPWWGPNGHCGYLADGVHFYFPDWPASEWAKHKTVRPLFFAPPKADVVDLWQPIETAPKDGGDILICGGTYSYSWYEDEPFASVSLARWYGDHWRGEDMQAHDEWRSHKPTHWMHAPAPLSAAAPPAAG